MVKKIGTHSGTFHCDEALACYLLLQTEEFANSEIVRTRDQKILDTLDIIVDVGAVYDPEKKRFDHHQGEFQGTLNDQFTTRLSSAGLIYKHYGREVLEKLMGSKDHLELVFHKVYVTFIQAIDAIDNGINQYETDKPARYEIHTDLGSRVGGLNPKWNEPSLNPDDAFKQAVALTGKEFTDAVMYIVKTWLPARSIVEEAIKHRFEVDPSGKILKLPQFCPWKQHLFDIESEHKVEPPIVYVLFSESSGWRVQCVPKDKAGFENRLSLLWKGLRDEELSKTSGIPGGVFVHLSGFIGGNKTYEGALEMARRSLTQDNK